MPFIAHLNLRENFLPYKNIIASVLTDKNPSIRTVINKIDDVGEENEYRTFKYEVLAGPDDLRVEVREQDCIFNFNYAKVYWNTRLNTEHTRLVQTFRPGEAVCDVMAGVGPFAVPAAKRKVFVWANDLNPDSYESLKNNINRNKVLLYPLLGTFSSANTQEGHPIRPPILRQRPFLHPNLNLPPSPLHPLRQTCPETLPHIPHHLKQNPSKTNPRRNHHPTQNIRPLRP